MIMVIIIILVLLSCLEFSNVVSVCKHGYREIVSRKISSERLVATFLEVALSLKRIIFPPSDSVTK